VKTAQRYLTCRQDIWVATSSWNSDI